MTGKLVPATAMHQNERDALWLEIMGSELSPADFAAMVASLKLQGEDWM